MGNDCETWLRVREAGLDVERILKRLDPDAYHPVTWVETGLVPGREPDSNPLFDSKEDLDRYCDDLLSRFPCGMRLLGTGWLRPRHDSLVETRFGGSSSDLAHLRATVCWGSVRNRDCILYPGVGTFVLIRPTQTFYERIMTSMPTIWNGKASYAVLPRPMQQNLKEAQ